MTARAVVARPAEPARVAETVPSGTVSASRSADASGGRAPFSAPSADGRVSTLLAPRVQMETRVSSPGDPAEREAVDTARKVMRMAAPPPPPPAASSSARPGLNTSPLLRAPSLARSAAAAPPSTIHRAPSPAPRPRAAARAAGPPRAPDDVMSEIRSEMGGGAPLPASVRGFLEPRFRAGFGAVLVHTGEKAASLAARLSARAFTFGKHIFFGAGEYRPSDPEGLELIAHELTHTIQQKEVVQRQEAVTVSERSQPQVQRLGFDDILDWLADKANAIPGFRMFTIVLGVNPVNMSPVDRSAANILRAVVEFIPGGNLITRALDTYGIFDKVGNWIEGQIRSLGMVGSAFKSAITQFIGSLGVRDLFRPGSVWNRAKRIFTDPIDQLIRFAAGFIGGILDFLREAVLRPLAKLAEGTQAYPLLKAVLGKDPITGDPVPQDADALIGGFMTLIGQQEVYENIKKGNAVARALAWFKGVLSGVLAFVTAVPGLIVSTLRSITLQDFLPITNLFAKVGRAFGGFVGSFLSWGLDQVLGLLQIIFEVVAPSVMPYVRKAAGAFKQIVRNPIGFIGNLVRAGIQGFRQFGGNFLSHLRASLIAWLTGTMAGASIYIPQAFNLREIIKFVLSVLGLTWQNIRTKLVRVVGEGPVRAMETGFDIVRTLVTQGPAAAWDKIQEGISNLREMVMEQVMSFVRTRIVQAAITRLVTSLNPAGAFIQAIIAIYNTVMFFIERLRQIAQVAMSFIDSISAIASGAIGAAANRVETTMAGLLTLVISFLARLVGLGRVSDAVINIVNRVRAPIDRALDRVIAWIVAQARRLGRFVAQAGVPQDPATRLRLASQAAVAAARRLSGRVTAGLLTPVLAGIRMRYGLALLEPYEQRGTWWVRATVNPTTTTSLGVSSAAGGGHLPSDGEVGEAIQFSAGGEGHRLWIDARGASAEVMLASSPKPLSEYLREFRTQARDIEDPASKAQVLGWIGTALGYARAIERDARRAAQRQIDTPQRDALDTQIEANERLLRPVLTDILNALNVTVPARIAPRLQVHFTTYPGIAMGEYRRQLRMQQNAINAMVVADWITNRMRYAERRAATGSGRHPLSGQAQANLRAVTRSRLILQLTQPASAPSPTLTPHERRFVAGVFRKYSETTKRRGLAESTATAHVDAWMRTQHALHSPDQVAGGRFDDLTGLGAGSVNVDIGKNWGGWEKPVHLANQLHRDVLAAMRTQRVRRAFWRQVRMDIELIV